MPHKIVAIALIALFGGMNSNYVLACSTVVGCGQQLSAAHNTPLISRIAVHPKVQQATVTPYAPMRPHNYQQMPVKETNKP